eukprot:12663651-Alexandrium_andersonii.AAC.1
MLERRQTRQAVGVAAPAPGREGIASAFAGSGDREAMVAPSPAGVARGGGGEAGSDLLAPARAAGAGVRRSLGRAP